MQIRIYAMYNQSKTSFSVGGSGLTNFLVDRALKIILSLLFVLELSAEFAIGIAKLATDHGTWPTQ
jgi:hypothetical protein